MLAKQRKLAKARRGTKRAPGATKPTVTARSAKSRTKAAAARKSRRRNRSR